MQWGNVNAAIRVLTNNMSHGIPPLNKETLKTPNIKTSKEWRGNKRRPPPIKEVNSVVFESIGESLILKSAQATQVDLVHQEWMLMNWENLWHPRFMVIVASIFEQLLQTSQNKCVEKTFVTTPWKTSFIACRLISFDKKLVLRPISVGGVLRSKT